VPTTLQAHQACPNPAPVAASLDGPAAIVKHHGTRPTPDLKPPIRRLFAFCLIALGDQFLQSRMLWPLQLLLLSTTTLLLPACTSSALTPAQIATTDNPLTLTADWDDLDAGVEVGLSQAEAVQVGKPAVSADRRERVYHFQHITGLKGALTATRLGEPSAAATVRLACRAGTISQPDLERRVLARVGLRLTDLLGREFAPIRD